MSDNLKEYEIIEEQNLSFSTNKFITYKLWIFIKNKDNKEKILKIKRKYINKYYKKIKKIEFIDIKKKEEIIKKYDENFKISSIEDFVLYYESKIKSLQSKTIY